MSRRHDDDLGIYGLPGDVSPWDVGRERPPFLQVPIIPDAPVPVVRQPEEPAAVSIDGDLGEWAVAERTGVAFEAEAVRLRFAFDESSLYLALEGPASGAPVDVYLGGDGLTPDDFGRILLLVAG